MTNNEIDNKVAEYLERAIEIIRCRYPDILTVKKAGLAFVEIAKMIQREEHHKDITESPNNRLSTGD